MTQEAINIVPYGAQYFDGGKYLQIVVRKILKKKIDECIKFFIKI